MQSKPFASVTKFSRRAATTAAATAASRSCALQEPWQPATQMLSMADYAAMEGDSAKYERYQLAIVDALCDIIIRRASSGALRVRILLVGAGRGPLVHRCLTAADIVAADVTPLHVDIVALERNLDAHNHCVANFASLAASVHSVRFIHADVVCISGDELRNLCGTGFELVVSELLGSFADNELAPEVLSVVALNTQLLARECAFIPQRHTSYLYPVSSARLRSVLETDSTVPSDVRYGSPWVVSTAEMPHCRPLQRMPPLPAMDFSYAWNAVADSSACSSSAAGSESACASSPPSSFSGQLDVQDQSRALAWMLDPICGALHLDGMLGVFHCVLYGDVTLSTVPGRETPGLTEWRPMFFPFRHVQVPLRQVEAPAVGWSLVVSIARAVRVDGVENLTCAMVMEWCARSRRSISADSSHPCDDHCQSLLL
jgi:protein arginine N-methyltransferase 5